FGSSRTGLFVTTSEQAGVVGDLYSGDGRLLARDASLLDLRNTEAGTYYLRVHRATGSTVSGPLAFSLAITAPKAGASHPVSDRDDMGGEDGEGVLIGNADREVLRGGGGGDQFVAELAEVLDETGESIAPPPASEFMSAQPRAVDPLLTAAVLPDPGLR